MNHTPFLNSRILKAFLLFPIIVLLVLTAGSGQTGDIQAAGVNANCYEVYLPVVIGGGDGGNGAPPSSAECSFPGHQFADFNGDGYADLAIGVPWENIMFNGTDVQMAGAVNVIYGSAAGLTADNNQIWHRASPGILLDPEEQDMFGISVTAGDFNSDGYDDLAIGVVNSTAGFPAEPSAGVVQIIYGSSSGLTAAGNEVLEQGSNGISDSPDSYDNFGARLETGDYDGDGHDDLAISAVGEVIEAVPWAGAVHILYGGSGGFRPGDHFISQATNGSPGDPQPDERFGMALTSGDFNNDSYSDLAVGIPEEDILGAPSHYQAGAVQIFYGNSYGLVDISTYSVISEIWHLDSNDYVYGDAADDDEFGTSVEAADFDGDGFDDLAVGTPKKDYGSVSNSGAITVFYGSYFGIDATAEKPAQLYTQATIYMGDDPEQDDYFGQSLAAADFDNDGYPDLAIGIPHERNFFNEQAGAVSIMYGTENGLSSSGSLLTFHALLESDNFDSFGEALTTGDYNGDGFTDLAVGVPWDTIETGPYSGSVIIRYSNSSGVTGPISQEIWHQDTPGILDTAEDMELFGNALH